MINLPLPFKILIFFNLMFIYSVQAKNFQCLSNAQDDIDNFTKFKNLTHFADAMCAQCYWYLAEINGVWTNHSFVDINMFPLWGPPVKMCFPNLKICYEFKYSEIIKHDLDNLFLKQFRAHYHMDLFLKCCEDAKKCCEKILKIEEKEVSEGNRCPAKWDGWMCWDSAEPGTTSWKTCPDMSYSVLGYIPKECSKEYATKECYPNGTWATIWTNDSGVYSPKDSTNYMKCSTPGIKC